MRAAYKLNEQLADKAVAHMTELHACIGVADKNAEAARGAYRAAYDLYMSAMGAFKQGQQWFVWSKKRGASVILPGVMPEAVKFLREFDLGGE
jgi:hypothetical protein